MLGGVDFHRAAGNHVHVVAVDGASNAKIYVDEDGGGFDDSSQSLTAEAKVRFAYSPPLDTLFAANYSDATRSFNGSLWSTTTDVTDAPKAKFVISFGDRIYLLHTSSYVDRAYRSSTVESGEITWDSDDWVAFYDIITGVGINGDNMFVGAQNSCWIFTLEDVKYKASSHGCVSHDGIASYGSWTFYPSYDGMYVYDGASDTKMSLPIKDFWDAIPTANLSSIQAKVKGHHLYIYIGDVTVDGRTLANVMFDYNILQNNWTRIALGEEVKDMHTFTESTGIELFIGNDDGEVFQMFSGEDQNGSVFTAYIETPWFFGSGPRNIDDFGELWAHGDKLSGLKAKYRVDNRDWVAIGELNGFSDFAKFSVSGKRIRFLLEETSKDNLYELYALEVGFVPKFPEKDINKGGL